MSEHPPGPDVETPIPAGSALAGASTGGIPPDLLAEAAKRLGWAGLLYSLTFFLGSFGPHLVASPEIIPDHSIWERGLQTYISIASIALGLLVFLFARFSRLEPQLLLDLGLVFEVVGAFGISMAQFWGFFPRWHPSLLENFYGIPWECVWILIFPLIAPNTPGKTLLASLAAASTGILTIALSKTAGLTDPATPMSIVVIYFAFSTYVCAGLAYFISRTVYRIGRRLKQARDIGSYHLLRPLGEGGMGEVWLARHRMLARPAAIKLIRPEALGSEGVGARTVLERFEREARATAALGSNHTVTIFDFGITEDGAFYYVMELLDGLNLDQLVTRFGPLPHARAVFLLRQACHSLGEAHQRGLIHRDVKPANIYVCRQGPDCDFVKLLDFGLVKSAGGQRGAELSAEGIAAGTPAFMAPEVATGAPYIDARVDIYGLGCVAYWLLTGQPVFLRDTPLATIVAHVQDEPIPPSRMAEIEVPHALDSIILRCLEKDPQDRPASVRLLTEMLAEVELQTPWDQLKAAEWWRLHLPESVVAISEGIADISGRRDVFPDKA